MGAEGPGTIAGVAPFPGVTIDVVLEAVGAVAIVICAVGAAAAGLACCACLGARGGLGGFGVAFGGPLAFDGPAGLFAGGAPGPFLEAFLLEFAASAAF